MSDVNPTDTTTSTSSSDFGPIEPEIHLNPSTVITAGCIILPLNVIFAAINSYFLYSIYRNWSQIEDSLYTHSYLLCIMLTISDLLFCLLVGTPAGLHMALTTNFQEHSTMGFYTTYILFFILEYLFFLRVIIVAVLAADKCLHLTMPLRYTFFMDTQKVLKLGVIMVILPVLARVIPNGVDVYYSGSTMICLKANDMHIVPLTCEVELSDVISRTSGAVNPTSLIERDLAILISLVTLGFLTILVCDVTIFTYLLLNISKIKALSHGTSTRSGNFIVRTLYTWGTSIIFALTNFPYAWIRLQQYRHQILDQENTWIENTPKFLLYIMMFISLLCNPWVYLLKMKSLRDLALCRPCNKKKRIQPTRRITRDTECTIGELTELQV